MHVVPYNIALSMPKLVYYYGFGFFFMFGKFFTTKALKRQTAWIKVFQAFVIQSGQEVIVKLPV